MGGGFRFQYTFFSRPCHHRFFHRQPTTFSDFPSASQPIVPCRTQCVSGRSASSSDRIETKLPTSSRVPPNHAYPHAASNSISGSSQQLSSLVGVGAGLRATGVASRADFGMQDEMLLMPLHGAARDVFISPSLW